MAAEKRLVQSRQRLPEAEHVRAAGAADLVRRGQERAHLVAEEALFRPRRRRGGGGDDGRPDARTTGQGEELSYLLNQNSRQIS